MAFPKYLLELGTVKKVKPHKSDNDGVNYNCEVELDNGNLVNSQVASPRMGFACIPEAKDRVLVGFIDGKLTSPIILGTVYSDKVKPPQYHPGETVYVCPKYSQESSSDPKPEEIRRFYMELPSKKMKFVLREEDIHYELEKYKFDLKSKDGLKLEVNEKTSLAISKDGDITITVKDTKISINKEGEVAIDAKKDVGIKTSANVNLESTGGNMKLAANKITLDAKQAIEIKGANAKMEASANLELKGANAKVNADAQLELKGGATAKLEASGMMDVKSSGILNVKGSLVNIN